jgi:hypothetical protein
MTRSEDAFISKCELAILLEELEAIPACACQAGPPRISRLAEVATRLDQWKRTCDGRRLFDRPTRGTDHAPGVQALQLLYFGAKMMVIRAVWDAYPPESSMTQITSSRSCLAACQAVLDFIANLSQSDLCGYWSSR